MSGINLTSEQYLVLSGLAYAKGFEHVKRKAKISHVRSLKLKGVNFSNLEMKALSTLDSWLLLDTVTTSSGMSAIALQNPDTKEVVFAL